jgi:deoxyribodipyrimidine photo-lyase
MAPKRKAAAITSALYADSTGSKANKRSEEASPKKKARTTNGDGRTNGASISEEEKERKAEEAGIIQRDFYPAEMSNERAARYNNNEIPRPIELLENAIAETASERENVPTGKAVLHWFKRDLRIQDNRGLALAAAKAKEANIPLVTLYVVSPQDFQAHFTSEMRVDFDLRTLEIMKQDLGELDIPLHVVTVEKRKEVPKHILDLCDTYEIKHVFTNIEYEVDELRREAKLTRSCLENGIDFTAVHDDVVVPPGRLKTGAGKQYAVYSPWFRSWIAHIHAHPELLEASPAPSKNPNSARKTFRSIFEASIPPAPENKRLSPDRQAHFAKLWPAGEHEAQMRLTKFLRTKISKYATNRNIPSAGATAVVSVHHSAGTLAARTSVRMARDANTTKKLDGGDSGIAGWISEVAWRDFYKHVLAQWPYVCMFKPFKYEYSDVRWEYDDEAFEAWAKGMTGFPIGELTPPTTLLHMRTWI